MNEPSKAQGGAAGTGAASLAKRHCQPCGKGTPALAPAEIGLLAASVPAWSVVDQGGVNALERAFKLPDFRAAIAFVNRVADLAEEEAHHPDLEIRYDLVTISSWTHVAKGLTENDFILASKIDGLASAAVGA